MTTKPPITVRELCQAYQAYADNRRGAGDEMGPGQETAFDELENLRD
ncbi:MAG: hypothetical protein HC898_11200 [Phycisphaerales bacterium]|nr:hypothetical protein [Phycisphaerales bacterium]